MPKFFKIIILISAFSFYGHSYASIAERDWMKYLNESCSTTVTGKVKRLTGELAFWSHLNASMDWWAKNQMLDPVSQNVCMASYSHPSQREKLLKCLSHDRRMIEW